MTDDTLVRVSMASVLSRASGLGTDYLRDVHAAAVRVSGQFAYMTRNAHAALCDKWRAVPNTAGKPVFDRVLVINRAARTDRMARAHRWWIEAGMGDVKLERFPAVEGNMLPLPAWWHAGGPAWGCAQSHMRALESCIVSGAQAALILEDDVGFGPAFAERTAQFMRALPPDWDQAYLGGQYLQHSFAPPWRMNAHVRMPFNVNRTHAYAVSRQGAHRLYAFLADTPRWQRFRGSAHVDHYYGHAHNQGLWSVYAAREWTCNQAGGLSDLTGAHADAASWDLGDCCTVLHTPVVVVGTMRSGTSMVCAMLSDMGVYLGENLMPSSRADNPEGFFEDRRVVDAYTSGFNKVTGVQLTPDAPLIDALSCVRRAAFVRRKRLFGLKHAYLMSRPDLLRSVLGGDIRVIHVTRDPNEAAVSLERTGWFPGADCLLITRTNADMIAAAAGTFPKVLSVRYRDCLDNPEGTAKRMAEFVGADITRVRRAAGRVDPTKSWRTPQERR